MGSVYVCSNPKMLGLVKIGRIGEETEEAVIKRMKELSAPTGVPGKFVCDGAWTFKNELEVEKTLHFAFKGALYDREFFTIDIECVIAILKQFGKKDVTPGRGRRKRKSETTSQAKKRPPFTFSKVGIKQGEKLVSIWDPNIECQVIDDRNKVNFEGVTMSLSAAAKIANKRRGKNWSSVSGPASWMYGDPPELLTKLRKQALG